MTGTRPLCWKEECYEPHLKVAQKKKDGTETDCDRMQRDGTCKKIACIENVDPYEITAVE